MEQVVLLGEDELDETQREICARDTLDRKRHIERLIEGIKLPGKYQIVPCQSWTVFWIAHSLVLLEQQQILDNIVDEVIEFIRECAHKDGGYGGGPGQIAHLATTFAAVNALVELGNEKALESIDRESLVRFLHRMKQENGSFRMHEDGEIDSRATYCALSILRCLNVHDSLLLENSADWILSCQTYEGGFASVPGAEAHGGYTFCCVASLCLVNQLKRADLPSLLRWLASKQLADEGGFCGRSNKLVDSCYSYWQAAVFPLLHPHLGFRDDKENDVSKSWLFDAAALQDYILNQCQARDGLLRDKPGAEPDFYHTCYALSGLSISQYQPDGSLFDIGSKPINILNPTHQLFNLTIHNLNFCFEYFKNKRLEIAQEKEAHR